MQIEVDDTTTPQVRNFKRGDEFPVLVRQKGTQKHRIFFSEHVSIIVSGGLSGHFTPQTCSVYDEKYVVASGASTTITFTQD